MSSSSNTNSGEVWVTCHSKSQNREYWFNKVTKVSVWERPTTGTIVSSLEANISATTSTAITSNATSSSNDWIKKFSTSQNKSYWFHKVTGQTTWTDPITTVSSNDTTTTTTAAGDDVDDENRYDNKKRMKYDYDSLIDNEKSLIVVNDVPHCPRIIEQINIDALVNKLKNETTTTSVQTNYKIIFTLADDDCALLSRAVQEDEILKTKLKLRKNNSVVDLPSFWELWCSSDKAFCNEILMSSNDPNEMKWALQKKYGYKLATTFQPGYAKSIYEYFNASFVLDPCAGWGCRMLGAVSSGYRHKVTKYVAFDPNRNLRPGYCTLMKLFNQNISSMTDKQLCFDNGYEVHSLPFEVGALNLKDNSFDLVFTSPPFFDYEMYNPNNPGYKDWIKDFYTPLMVQSCRCVKPGKFVCIHIGDTSAGNIVPFLKEQVHLLCDLKLVYNIGLRGVMSDKVRDVWIFQKGISTATATSSSSVARIASHEQIERVNTLTNPKVHISTFTDSKKVYTLFDDGKCIGGTKQRLLGRILSHIKGKEVIYAGPDGGIAQVALAYTAKLWDKQASIFLNTYVGMQDKPVLLKLAASLGAKMHLCDSSTGRTLRDTQAAAAEYAAEDPANRVLMPFGLKFARGELYFKLFRDALLEALPVDMKPPERLWIVAGSGFLFDVLHSIWPQTEYLVVQVGKKIWPDQLEGKKIKLFISDEKFAEVAMEQPPYRTIPWYDAKLWTFVKRFGKDNDAIWNVGSLPETI